WISTLFVAGAVLVLEPPITITFPFSEEEFWRGRRIEVPYSLNWPKAVSPTRVQPPVEGSSKNVYSLIGLVYINPLGMRIILGYSASQGATLWLRPPKHGVPAPGQVESYPTQYVLVRKGS
ncbi:MAG: hypothetical protein WA395_14985, partial [Nitrososphaeraceae archaeon]